MERLRPLEENDLAVSLEVDGDDLERAPVGEPETTACHLGCSPNTSPSRRILASAISASSRVAEACSA
jgi:hypothetical protein